MAQKRRTPDTIEDALDQAIGFVGVERVAGWIGKSADMVRKFSDPDKEHHLQLRCGIEIDRQLALGGWPQPFAELVAFHAGRHATAARQLEAALTGEGVAAPRPLQQAAEAVVNASRLVASIEKAEADDVYTAAEVDGLLAEIGAMQRQLPVLKRALVARRGAKVRT